MDTLRNEEASPRNLPGDNRFTAPLGLLQHLRDPGTKLDVIPVLDLCVIALLFSLVFTRFVMVPGIRVDLPDTGLRMQQNAAPVAVLTIQNKGMLFFDGGVYESGSITKAFQSYLARTAQEGAVLLMKVEADMSIETFMELCRTAQEAGFTEVQVAGEKPGEPVPLAPSGPSVKKPGDDFVPVL